MPGRLIGIAYRDVRRAPMQTTDRGLITSAAGLAGDFKGAKYPRRQITVLALEAWQAALAEIAQSSLPWTARRANLLVEGVELPRAAGGVLRIGAVQLEVTGQTYPCSRMEEAQAWPAVRAGQGLAGRRDLPCAGRWAGRPWRCGGGSGEPGAHGAASAGVAPAHKAASGDPAGRKKAGKLAP
jgi:hypothetical protein